MPPYRSEEPLFVFVGGVPRSGTSLLQKILDFHSEIYGGPEVGILKGLMRNYELMARNIASGKVSMVLGAETARLAYRNLLRTVFQERVAAGGFRIISEKTPANIDVFPELAEVFPEARFLWVIRDPRDVVASLQAVQERGRKKGVAVDAGRWLHRDLREMRGSLETGDAFRRSHPERLHVVYYEDLVTEPRRFVEDVCAFVGVGFEESMLATERTNDTSLAIESDRPTKGVFYTKEMYDRPIDAAGIGRWKSELGAWTVLAVKAELAGVRLPPLDRYQLGRPGRPWMAVHAASSRLSSVASLLLRRVRPPAS